jgi:hypothetical protein
MTTTSERPAGTSGGYAPLVPTFSPYTASATDAVRLAWRVTVLAFAAFAALVIGGPAAQRWYVSSAIEPRPAQLTSIDGIVFLRKNGSRDWAVAGPDAEISPGDTLRTAANARGFLQLFDQSTVLIYPSSTLKILRAEQGRFRTEKRAVVLELSQGRARIGVAPSPAPNAAFFQIRTPDAQVHLQEGSYSADAAKGSTQFRVRVGEATAYSDQGIAMARAGQRLMVRPDRAPQGNQPMRGDLLENGWFTERSGGVPNGWVFVDLSDQEPIGTISLADVPGAVSFRRTGRGHGETVLSQHVDIDLWDFEKVSLAADLRVFSHSLSGGGWMGSEYPIMLRVTYRDATGGVHRTHWGYYLHNEERYPAPNGKEIPQGDWFRAEIDLLAQVPRPWRIQSVEVVASGWDYSSAVREVHLWAE